MNELFQVDWNKIFSPSGSLGEIIVRGTLVYLILFVFLRYLLKREAGVLGIADLLVIVLIADAAQNAMGSDYKSITEGMVLVGTIIFWNFLLDWLGYRFPAFERFVRPAPLSLIEDGQINRRNMRREMITYEELLSQLRQHGIEEPSEVKRAYMEGDGSISIIAKESQNNNESKRDEIIK